MYKDFLERYFEEKKLPNEQFVVKHKETGGTHMIDSETIIDIIVLHADPETQGKVVEHIVYIDGLKNGNIMKYLKDLAEMYVSTNF